MSPSPLHPLPPKQSRWGYDHTPPVYGVKDSQATAQTEGSVAGSMLRLVGGYDRKRETWSRGWDSWISLDTYSVGVAHWWSETAPDLFATIANEVPGLAAWGWGDEGLAILRDPDRLRELTGTKRGKMPHDPDLDWLLAGWYEIARHPAAVRIQARTWLENYGGWAWSAHRRYGWKGAASLAGLARMRNSGAQRYVERALDKLGRDADENEVMKLAMSDGYYDHPERWDAILADPVLAGRVTACPTVDDLRLETEIVRTDGSKPEWSKNPDGYQHTTREAWRETMRQQAEKG